LQQITESLRNAGIECVGMAVTFCTCSRQVRSPNFHLCTSCSRWRFS